MNQLQGGWQLPSSKLKEVFQHPLVIGQKHQFGENLEEPVQLGHYPTWCGEYGRPAWHGWAGRWPRCAGCEDCFPPAVSPPWDSGLLKFLGCLLWFHVIFSTVCDNRVIVTSFHKLKTYKMSCMNDRDVLFFAVASNDVASLQNFFHSSQMSKLSMKNYANLPVQKEPFRH